MELAKLTKGAVAFYNLDGEEIQKEMKTIEWDAEAAEKSGYEHFMLKEIHEQPDAMKNTILPRLTRGLPDFSEEEFRTRFSRTATRSALWPAERPCTREWWRGPSWTSPAHSGAGLRRLRVPL